MEVQTLDRTQSTTVHPVDREREWNELPARALGRAGISGKAAATDVPCDGSLLSARLAGKKHLPWSHLGKWGADFARELVLLIIELYDLQIGMTTQDVADMQLGRTMREAMQRSLAR